MAKLTRCPVCKKQFEDIGEGWRVIMGCPKCGLRQVDAERVHNETAEPKTETPKASKSAATRSYKSLHLTRAI